MRYADLYGIINTDASTEQGPRPIYQLFQADETITQYAAVGLDDTQANADGRLVIECDADKDPTFVGIYTGLKAQPDGAVDAADGQLIWVVCYGPTTALVNGNSVNTVIGRDLSMAAGGVLVQGTQDAAVKIGAASQVIALTVVSTDGGTAPVFVKAM
jgi:hypothetical protein